MALTIAQIQNAYVAFFNRPADVAGLNYWSNYAGNSADLLNTFAESAEYKGLYAGLNNTQLVNAIYQNLFGRTPDVAGLNYWVTQLDNGTLKVGNIADAVNKGAQGTDKTIIENKTAAATAFTSALDTTAEIVAYAGVNSTGLQAVKTWLNTLNDATKTVASVTGAELTSVLNTVQNNVATVGQTFTLTANADSVTGTSGNDTFNGTNTTLQATDVIRGGEGRDTLNYTDASVGGTNLPVADVAGIEVINIRNVGQGTAATAEVATVTFGNLAAGETVTIGAATYTEGVDGAGTAALLAAFFAANVPVGYALTSASGTQVVYTNTTPGIAADLTVGGTGAAKQAIAIVQGTAAGAVATNTFSAANLIGAEEFNTVNSIGAVTVTNLAAGQSLGMVGNGATTVGALTGTYGDAVTSTTLNLKDGLQTGAAGGTLQGAGAVVINGAGIATANINSTGAANAVGGISFGGAAVTTLNIKADSAFGLTAANTIAGFSATQTSTINVTGAGAVRINVLDANLDVYNASAATGVQTLTLGSATQQVTLGSGNDIVTTGSIQLTTGSVAAGAGSADRLILTATTDIDTLAEGARYSGFEQVQIQAGQTLDLDLLAANNSIGSVRMQAGAIANNLSAVQASNISVLETGAVTVGVKGAATAGQIDTVKLSLVNSTAAGAQTPINLTGSSLVGVEKLELSTTGSNAINSGIITFVTNANTAQLDSIKLASAANGNILTISSHITAANLNVDASASSGNTTINAQSYGGSTGASIKAGSGNDTIISSARADVVDLSVGGRDFVSAAGSTVAQSDVIKGFGLVSTAINDVSGIIATFQNAGIAAGGTNADVLNGVQFARAAAITTPMDVAAASGNAAAADIKAVVNERGLLTLSGADVGLVDTIEEWVAIADRVTNNAGNTDGVANASVVFNFNGNAYIFNEATADGSAGIGVNDLLVTLQGVTATGISLVGVAGTALVGEVLVNGAAI